MGTDIHGYIECYTKETTPGSWIPIMDLYPLFPGRDYDSFACLFGVRNFARFRPIAEDRGLPDDVTEKVREEFPVEDGYHSYTWITYREIQAIDGTKNSSSGYNHTPLNAWHAAGNDARGSRQTRVSRTN